MHLEERWFNIKRELIVAPWSRERLENERDTLIFIAQNTTIRVPKLLHFSIHDNVASITTETVKRETMHELVEKISEEDKERLTSNVFLYINETVLPQLNKLTSKTLGSVRGDIIPPVRLQMKDDRPHWPSRTSATEDFVFCHIDLGQHNIMVDPETLQVVSIIDWEYSGFYPRGFESPFWLEPIPTALHPPPGGWENWKRPEHPAVEHLIKLIDKPGNSALV